VDELTPDMLRRFTEVDSVDEFAYVAQVLDRPGEPGAGVARYRAAARRPAAAESP
jgi:hypothetical protein